MSRTIEITTDVFAAIWAERRAGEESENEILRRHFGCEAQTKPTVPSTSAHEEQSKIGFWDARFGVGYPEGFEVFRRYKGQEFRAKATNGVWIRSDTGARYPSLNKLNESIAAGSEDVWRAWEFRDQNGKNRSIDELRQKSGARFLK